METRAAVALTPKQWDDKFFAEYVRASRFNRYMGTTPNAIIQVKEDLTRKKGDTIHFATVRKLRGAGVTGNTMLEGNEEEIDSKGLPLKVGFFRHGVVVTDWEEQKSAIELMDAARPALRNWSMEKMKTDLITALQSVGKADGTSVAFSASSEAERDAWLTWNADRMMFGSLKSNGSSNDMSVALGLVDATDDKLTCAAIRKVKRLATSADPAIMPVRLGEDEEWFVYFADSNSFRDLSQDPEMIQKNKDARPRESRFMENPLFSGGDLVTDGVIVREIPEMPAIPGVGAAGINVVQNALVGAQALGIGWAQRLRSTTDVRDYGFRNGVGIEEARGIEKLRFEVGAEGSGVWKQHGVVSHFVASTPDT